MSGEPEADPVRVLLIEDNPGDVGLIREGLREGRLNVEVSVVEDGVQALSYLRREGDFADASAPDMILLDLNLPQRDGREVLADIKSDPALRRIPVCVVTSSADDHDVATAYDSHANSYVTKPMELDRYLDAVRQIERFWFATAALPRVASA